MKETDLALTSEGQRSRSQQGLTGLASYVHMTLAGHYFSFNNLIRMCFIPLHRVFNFLSFGITYDILNDHLGTEKQ